MDCSKFNGCSNNQHKSLSDSEQSLQYQNNRTACETNTTGLLNTTFCSDETTSQDIFHNHSSTTPLPGHAASNNLPRKVPFSSLDHIDLVPKAFIERSIHPKNIHQSEKKKHYTELIAQIESDPSELSTNSRNFNFSNENEHKLCSTQQFTPHLSVNEAVLECCSQPAIDLSSSKQTSKRSQPPNSYLSEDSNFSSVSFDYPNSYAHFQTLPHYFHNVPISFSNFQPNLNYSFDAPSSFTNYSSSVEYTTTLDNRTQSEIPFSTETYPYLLPYSEFDNPCIPRENSRIFKKPISELPKSINAKIPKPSEPLGISKCDEAGFSKTQPLPSIENSNFSPENEFGTVELAKDQHGSRLIQQRIESASFDDITRMINDLVVDEKTLVVLVGDVFGNYVIQKLLDHGDFEHRLTLVNKIRGSILHLAVQMYGCRVVQKAIEVGTREIQLIIIQELRGHVLECIKDQNGNHVIQKCIEKIDSSMLGFVIDEISCRVVELSTHPYGCRVIQRILENFDSQQKLCITEELFGQIPALVLDQYGNYVVQHILDHCNNSIHRNYVFRYVRSNLFPLSAHKFASNVVEKCLVSGSKEERREIVTEIILNSIGNDDDVVYKMMKDPFANYVIQKMIDVIINDKEHDLFNDLVKKISPHYPNLRKISYGKHIINKIDKIYSKITNSRGNSFPKLLGDINPSSGKHFHIFHDDSVTKIKDVRLEPRHEKKHVICDSLIEFPSLTGEEKSSSLD